MNSDKIPGTDDWFLADFHAPSNSSKRSVPWRMTVATVTVRLLGDRLTIDEHPSEIISTGVHPDEYQECIRPLGEAGAFRLDGGRNLDAYQKFAQWFRRSSEYPGVHSYSRLSLYRKAGPRMTLKFPAGLEAWYHRLDHLTGAVWKDSGSKGWEYLRQGWDELQELAWTNADVRKGVTMALNSENPPDFSPAGRQVINGISTAYRASQDGHKYILPTILSVKKTLQAEGIEKVDSWYSSALKETGFDWLPSAQPWDRTKK
jgi:hypothetical protein